jgi:hypothetical protein
MKFRSTVENDMHTIKIKIEDSFYPHFKALNHSLVESKKIAYVEKSDCNYEASYPKSVVLNTVAAVREKVLEAEKNVQNGCYVEEDVFWNNIDHRMKKT